MDIQYARRPGHHPAYQKNRSLIMRIALAAGQVISGHTMPFSESPTPGLYQKRFAEAYIEDDDIVNVVRKVFEVVPPSSKTLGKVKTQ